VTAFGLTAFCTDRSADPASVAVAAEAAGFQVLWFPDHTHIPVARRSPYPGGGELPEQYRRNHDPLVACAFAAAATTRLSVGIGVCLVPARDPIVLAKQVASLDVLSGGRFVLGVGAGWNEEEVEDHGVAAADRWAVMDERVRAMQAIWSQEEAEFHGRHVAFDPMWSWPKPLPRPGRAWPPIVVGGHGDAVLRRVVAIGDEWLAMVAPGRPPLGERMAELRRLAEVAGRPRPSVSVQVYGDPPEDRVIEKYRALGVDRIDLTLPSGGPEETLDALGRLGDAVAAWADSS
jgi:probable F420-dependent oxidoreductase